VKDTTLAELIGIWKEFLGADLSLSLLRSSLRARMGWINADFYLLHMGWGAGTSALRALCRRGWGRMLIDPK
jgi:hypothetical protein